MTGDAADGGPPTKEKVLSDQTSKHADENAPDNGTTFNKKSLSDQSVKLDDREDKIQPETTPAE